jgi:hypothetical protein
MHMSQIKSATATYHLWNYSKALNKPKQVLLIKATPLLWTASTAAAPRWPPAQVCTTTETLPSQAVASLLPNVANMYCHPMWRLHKRTQ